MHLNWQNVFVWPLSLECKIYMKPIIMHKKSLSSKKTRCTLCGLSFHPLNTFSLCLYSLLFLDQLTNNMTKDCSLNYEFSTWKLQAQNMSCKQIDFLFYFDIQNNLCTQHVLSMFCARMLWACNFYELNL